MLDVAGLGEDFRSGGIDTRVLVFGRGFGGQIELTVSVVGNLAVLRQVDDEGLVRGAGVAVDDGLRLAIGGGGSHVVVFIVVGDDLVARVDEVGDGLDAVVLGVCNNRARFKSIGGTAVVVHAALGVELAVHASHGAVEVDEHGAPVGVLTGRIHIRAHLHVVEVLDHLPEGEVLGLQAGDVGADLAHHAQRVVETVRVVGARLPGAVHLAHRQLLAVCLSDIARLHLVAVGVGVNVVLADKVLDRLRVLVVRLDEVGGVCSISGCDDGVIIVLERLSECGNRLLLLGVIDMHTLLRLLQRVGVWGDGPIFVGVVLIPVVVNELGVVIALIGVLRSHVARSAPVTGLGLVERLDRVNVCAKAFEVLDVLGHVLSEFRRVCKIIATRVVSTSGVTAVGQEPRSGVGEGLYIGDVRVIAGGTALNPPVLGGGLGEVILVVVSRVECRSQLVFVGLLGGYAIAIRAGAGGVIFPRARHGSALAHEWVAVGNIGGIAAAHVVAGHVQVQSFITEDGLVELFAQLFAVFHSLSLGSVIAEIGGDGRFLAEAAGGVGEPSQRGAPAIETVGIPRVRGHGNGIVISRIRSAGNRKRPSSH